MSICLNLSVRTYIHLEVVDLLGKKNHTQAKGELMKGEHFFEMNHHGISQGVAQCIFRGWSEQ